MRKLTERAVVQIANGHGSAVEKLLAHMLLDENARNQDLSSDRETISINLESVTKHGEKLRLELDEATRKGKDLCCAFGNALLALHTAKNHLIRLLADHGIPAENWGSVEWQQEIQEALTSRIAQQQKADAQTLIDQERQKWINACTNLCTCGGEGPIDGCLACKVYHKAKV